MNNPSTYDSDPTHASGMPTGTMPTAGTGADDTQAGRGEGSLKREVANEAENLKLAAQQKASEAAGLVRGEADRVRSAAEQKLAEVRGRAQTATSRMVNERKQRVAGQLGLVTEALSKTSEKLHQDQHGAIAQYTDLAAEKVEDFRRTIESKDVGDLVDDLQRFARRQPGLVFGGMFLAGLAAMRFMKASSQDRTDREVDRFVAEDPELAYGRTLSPRQSAVVGSQESELAIGGGASGTSRFPS